MIGIAIVIVVILIAGIAYFSLGSPTTKKPREQFLQELAKFVEGKLEPVTDPNSPNAFRIGFSLEDENFIYEDLEEPSFREPLFKGNLECQTPSRLTLYFIEKEHSDKKVSSGPQMISQVGEAAAASETKKVELPKNLKRFNVLTNAPDDANHLLEDDRVSRIFSDFQNKDTRGRAFLSLKILEGRVMLEFNSNVGYKPSRADLMNNVASLENYVEKLLPLIKRLKKIE